MGRNGAELATSIGTGENECACCKPMCQIGMQLATGFDFVFQLSSNVRDAYIKDLLIAIALLQYIYIYIYIYHVV